MSTSAYAGDPVLFSSLFSAIRFPLPGSPRSLWRRGASGQFIGLYPRDGSTYLVSFLRQGQHPVTAHSPIPPHARIMHGYPCQYLFNRAANDGRQIHIGRALPVLVRTLRVNARRLSRTGTAQCLIPIRPATARSLYPYPNDRNRRHVPQPLQPMDARHLYG
jgi:hypothetical protein